MLKTSQAGLDLIVSFEGVRLDSYLCPAGVWTIGVGHTGPEVHAHQTISHDQAMTLLHADLARFEKVVNDVAGGALNQNQFDACVSLAFNIGGKAFANSTLARHIRNHQLDQVAGEFRKWTKAGTTTILGLVRRRNAEAALFVKK